MQTTQKSAKIIWDDLFHHDSFKSDKNFTESCQQEAVPSSLKALVSMIILGTPVKEEYNSQATLMISQLLWFNSKKKDNRSPKKHFYATLPREALYTGLMIYSCTRNKQIIQLMHSLGLSVSYENGKTDGNITL